MHRYFRVTQGIRNQSHLELGQRYRHVFISDFAEWTSESILSFWKYDIYNFEHWATFHNKYIGPETLRIPYMTRQVGNFSWRKVFDLGYYQQPYHLAPDRKLCAFTEITPFELPVNPHLNRSKWQKIEFSFYSLDNWGGNRLLDCVRGWIEQIHTCQTIS